MDYCETLNIAFPFWIYIWTRIIRIEDIYRHLSTSPSGFPLK